MCFAFIMFLISSFPSHCLIFFFFFFPRVNVKQMCHYWLEKKNTIFSHAPAEQLCCRHDCEQCKLYSRVMQLQINQTNRVFVFAISGPGCNISSTCSQATLTAGEAQLFLRVREWEIGRALLEFSTMWHNLWWVGGGGGRGGGGFLILISNGHG